MAAFPAYEFREGIACCMMRRIAARARVLVSLRPWA
jgi:hypothetical protein